MITKTADSYIRVRNAKSQDNKSLLDLLDHVSKRDNYFLAHDFKKEHGLVDSDNYWKNTVVATNDGKIVGLAKNKTMRDGSTLLDELYVHPEFRHKGITDDLLSKTLGAHRDLRVKTRHDNAAMNHILQRKKFKPDNIESKATITWSN